MIATIVVRSRTKDHITGDYFWEYCLLNVWRDGFGLIRTRGKSITRQQAKAYIEKNGLTESHSTRDGQIYEAPDRPFKSLFPNGIMTRQELEAIEKTDQI